MQIRGTLLAAFAHATAAGIVIALSLVLTSLTYVGFLLWAVFAGSPIGGPLAIVGMLLVAFVASILAAGLVFFPVTLVTSLLCTWLKWPRAAQIPVATLLCVVEVLMASLVAAAIRHSDAVVALRFGAVVALLLLVPLGVYWWVLQFHDLIRWVANKIWARFRRNGSPEVTRRPAV